MSEITTMNRQDGMGRTLLWLALLAAIAFLTFISSLASRHNPYYSDRAANGISKYKFLEACSEEAHKGGELNVAMGPQNIKLQDLLSQNPQAPLAKTDKIHSKLVASSENLVNSIQRHAEGGWTMVTPVDVKISKTTGEQPLGQLPMKCTYTKAGAKTEAVLQLQ